MKKVNVDASLHDIGLPAPTAPPTSALAPDTTTSTYYKELDDGESTANWNADGVIISSVAASNPVRVNTTITAVLYDTGTSGWCCVYPASIVNINEGAYLTIESGEADEEQVLVQSVHFGTTSTTISAITFDSGTAGDCSLVLTTQYDLINFNSMLYNETDTTYGRVLSVHEGPDGHTSLRVDTPTGSTWEIGDTIYAVSSFRTWTSNTAQAADDLDATGIGLTFSADAGIGTATKDIHAAPIDLTTITGGVNAGKDEYIHISIKLSDPSIVTQGRIMFDVTNQAVLADAFDNDYYYKAFRPNDLTAVTTGAATELAAWQRAANRFYIEQQSAASWQTNPSTPEEAYWQDFFSTYQPGVNAPSDLFANAPQGYGDMAAGGGTQPVYGTPTRLTSGYGSGELALGPLWQELRFKISDLVRVGNNGNRDLRAVYYIRLEFTVAAGALVADFGSLGLLGGHGPDCGSTGDYYRYRYRARCSTTGTVSNWSPASRNPIYSQRQQIDVAASAQYTSATEADLLEFQRWGGNLLEWHNVGIVSNSVAPTTLNDDMPNDVAAVNSSEGQINYQPWPIIGLPRALTASTVCGTTITSGTGEFSTAWAPGTRIELDNRVYTLYRATSTTHAELVENAGTGTAVTMRVPEPLIVSQPLYALWQYADTFFACGDRINPQRLYWMRRGTESVADINYYMDITSPSEPLQNGVVYNGRCYVWSSERMFEIQSNGDLWTYVEVPGGKGLWAKWCFTGFQSTPGPTLCFLSKDGIYESDGGAPVSMTEADLNPLFPNEGNLGITTNSILKPNMDSSFGGEFRLHYYDNHTYFDYRVDSSEAGLL